MRDFQLPGRSGVFAENGMCATSHPIAAKTAVQILESGGNAVDAAIAGAVVLGIAEPQMTGIGGDCFVLLKPAGEDRIVALNGSGRAPAGMSAQRLRDAGLSEMPNDTADAVTVPGAVDAFCRLSDDWGRIGLADCLAPAIHYADAGIPVAPRTAFDWKLDAGRLQGAARDLYLYDGRAPEPGRMFRSPRQAEALRLIARQGRAAFYEGEIADDMLETLTAHGGSHTPEDFAATGCSYGEPLSGVYRGTELVEHPPNGQGAAAILIANILSHFDLSGMDPFGAARAHVEAEAVKLGYDARDRFIADPDYTNRMAHMLAPETARDLAALIDPKRAMEHPSRHTGAAHKDTIYITVIDRDRMAVSLIYSIFKSFGTGIATSKYGILFHNRGSGFTLEAGHPNEAGPGKRPMHTIIPGMLRRDGKVAMSFGVMGGQYQSNGHVRLLSNLADFGMDLQSAIDAPRAFARAGVFQVERGYDEKVRAELAELGHNIVVPDKPIGGGQAIRIDHENGVLEGGSDPRKDGCALGY